MASGTQRSMAPAARSNQARATPQLQTSNSDLNRYSFMDTPVEMQRSTFQPYHQFSSPTNSVIDESPISPVSPARGLPAYQQGPQGAMTSPIPDQKAQAQSPQELHPAFFAPYREEQLAQQQAQEPPVIAPRREEGPAQQAQQAQQPQVAVAPQSPGPIPIKTPEAPPHFAAPPTSNSPPTQSSAMVPETHREIYNPDSLSGPNVGSENHRPGQVSHPNAAIDPRWKTGLCEPDTVCCMGIICPCMVYGKTMYRLSRRAQKQDPTDMLGYERCNGSCSLMFFGCGFQSLLAAIQRARVRKLYHLEGSFGADCLKACCCCCCVIMQDEREVRDREELIRRHAGPATAAYVAPEGMIYAPPPR
ncbi:MAG: hypothetical protein Q9161_000535 [Pseudevernia consocians]